MDITVARTFLEVVKTGSFVAAHSQSTDSHVSEASSRRCTYSWKLELPPQRVASLRP